MNGYSPEINLVTIVRHALANLIVVAVDITFIAVCLYALPFNFTREQSLAGAFVIHTCRRNGQTALRTLSELFTASYYIIVDCIYTMIWKTEVKTSKQEAEDELYRLMEPMPPIPSITIELSLKKVMEDPEQKKFMETMIKEATRRILAEKNVLDKIIEENKTLDK